MFWCFPAYFSVVDDAFAMIVNQAFAPTAAVGGFIGVLVQGFRRGAFSNEAGAGSASIAHSAVITSYPASEGLVALLEPFIDTVVICTMTALVIIIFNGDNSLFTYGNLVEGSTAVMVRGQELEGGLVSALFDIRQLDPQTESEFARKDAAQDRKSVV